jgi:hypothetical protein
MRLARLSAVLTCSAWPVACPAAGGHFAVDDAFLLDPGQCQIETWLEREGSTRSLVHLGPACRAGPLEIGLNVDRTRWRDRGFAAVVGPQVKWAHALDDRVSLGMVASVGLQGSSPTYAGASLYVPVSVRVAPSVLLHANGGRDWSKGAGSASRAGFSVEWQPSDSWTVVGERFRQGGANFARLGVRWQAGTALILEASRAVAVHGEGGGWWTVGAAWTFEAGPRGRSARRDRDAGEQ